jgi:UPF0176 protein
MQLYNTLSAERAIMIDDAGKQRLTLSFYANSRSNTISNDLFRAWDPLVVLGHICKRELTLSYHFRQIISML